MRHSLQVFVTKTERSDSESWVSAVVLSLLIWSFSAKPGLLLSSDCSKIGFMKRRLPSPPHTLPCCFQDLVLGGSWPAYHVLGDGVCSPRVLQSKAGKERDHLKYFRIKEWGIHGSFCETNMKFSRQKLLFGEVLWDFLAVLSWKW